MSQRTAAIDGISEKDIVRLLEGMLHFFGNLERYPLTNKIVADDAAGLHKAFVRMIGSSVPTITISELHNALEVNDTELSAAAQNNPVVEAFVFYMLEQNLRSIRISREISLQEFKAFLAMLVASKPSDDLAAQLREKNVRLAQIERQVERTVEETRFDKVPLETRSATRPTGMPRQDPTRPPTTMRPPTNMRESSSISPPPQRKKPAAPDPSGPAVDPRDITTVTSPTAVLTVKVLVGDHPVEGATVEIRNAEYPSLTSDVAGEAFFELPPGVYEVEIRAETYKIVRGVRISADQRSATLSVDLQKIFDY